MLRLGEYLAIFAIYEQGVQGALFEYAWKKGCDRGVAFLCGSLVWFSEVIIKKKMLKRTSSLIGDSVSSRLQLELFKEA